MFNTSPMHHAGQDGELSIYKEANAPTPAGEPIPPVLPHMTTDDLADMNPQ